MVVDEENQWDDSGWETVSDESDEMPPHDEEEDFGVGFEEQIHMICGVRTKEAEIIKEKGKIYNMDGSECDHSEYVDRQQEKLSRPPQS